MSSPGPGRFRPVTPDALARELADFAESRAAAGGPRIGVDGFAEVGAGELADTVAAELARRGRPVIRASTHHWWRAAALRLEFGRQDPDALLYSWVDAAALRRELLDPLGPGGDGVHVTALRDPDTDRSVRQERRPASPGAVLLLDGPFLQAAELPLDGLVSVAVTAGTAARRLPAERQWWIPVWQRYLAEWPTAADVVVAHDHPGRPAIGFPPRPDAGTR